ncbi:17472_t:CDS:1 [Acaulospora morrowiae]|uniref:17472_t:CDS:1 n=1 Tax=Acaulospora morrowiae TaxID=94023 RepID=A0A9N9ER59_9GLOM|nr:17472_t:CDS:1 [Acaulospora morrowiae]
MCISRVRSFSEYAIYVSRWKDKSNAEKIAHYERQEKEKIDEVMILKMNKEELERKLDGLESKNQELIDEIRILKANKEKTEQALKEKFEFEKKIYECIGAKDRDTPKKHNICQSDRSYNKRLNGKQEITMALHRESERLKLEAAKCQMAFGGVANFGWCDEEPNNLGQLIKDIEKLQRDLSSFTVIKGNDVKIHQDAVSELFERYKCKTSINDKTMKHVLSATLQRHILEIIAQRSEKYLHYSNVSKNKLDTLTDIPDERLEVGIKLRANDLCNLLERFCESTSSGDEDHLRVSPVKLRQQIYAILCDRGFTSQNHPFIQEVVRDLLTSMDKYRTIESKERNEKLASKAASLVQQVLNVFYFKLNTQDPVPLFKFYESGRKVDTKAMEGIWNGDPGNFEVEICAFPVVAVIKDDEEKNVLTKARVLVRKM